MHRVLHPVVFVFVFVIVFGLSARGQTQEFIISSRIVT